MTYTEFLVYFTIIPIIILLISLRGKLKRSYLSVIVLVSVIAFVATSAWDNFAVYSGIWYFPPEKTMGILFYYVPIEEYAFFFLQTFTTGLVQIFYLEKFFKPKSGMPPGNESRTLNINIILLIIYFEIANFYQRGTEEIIKLPFGKWNYLFHLFSWAGAFILIQLIFGRKKIKGHLKLIIVPSVIMTVYFSLADAVSIGNGIWNFDPLQTIGTKIGNVPLEEILFFLMTNILITEAMVLFLPEKYLNKNHKHKN